MELCIQKAFINFFWAQVYQTFKLVSEIMNILFIVIISRGFGKKNSFIYSKKTKQVFLKLLYNFVQT